MRPSQHGIRATDRVALARWLDMRAAFRRCSLVPPAWARSGFAAAAAADDRGRRRGPSCADPLLTPFDQVARDAGDQDDFVCRLRSWPGRRRWARLLANLIDELPHQVGVGAGASATTTVRALERSRPWPAAIGRQSRRRRRGWQAALEFVDFGQHCRRRGPARRTGRR